MKRWWLTTTDVFASLPESKDVTVKFDGGSANGHWHFRVDGSLPASKVKDLLSRPIQYDVCADMWIELSSWPCTSADKEAFKTAAWRRAPVLLNGADELTLNALVKASLEQPYGIVSGKRLRALRSGTDVEAAVGHLAPRYVERGGDTLQPTFEGLWTSSLRDRVVAIVDAVLAVLGTLFKADPDVESFALSDLLAVGVREDEKALVTAVVNTALLWGGPAQNGWRVPRDVEQLAAHVPSFTAFRAYCRDVTVGVPERSWELAPALLPDEISRDGAQGWWSPPEPVPNPPATTSPLHVFYSWQSDRPNATNRGLILDALERGLRDLRRDPSMEQELILERDTNGDPGAPHIAETILRKIDRATLFIADVSFIGEAGGRPTPNPNVLVELGYAIAQLGWDRLVLVFNDAFGRVEDLPFDLRHRRVLAYRSQLEDGERAGPRQGLQRAFVQAIRDHVEVVDAP